jgi:hypothetical protein
MTPGVQSKNDTRGGGEDNRQDDIAFCDEVEQRI